MGERWTARWAEWERGGLLRLRCWVGEVDYIMPMQNNIYTFMRNRTKSCMCTHFYDSTHTYFAATPPSIYVCMLSNHIPTGSSEQMCSEYIVTQ